MRVCNEYTESVDVWSAACIIYELTTLNILFEGTNTDNVWTSMCEYVPPFFLAAPPTSLCIAQDCSISVPA